METDAKQKARSSSTHEKLLARKHRTYRLSKAPKLKKVRFKNSKLITIAFQKVISGYQVTIAGRCHLIQIIQTWKVTVVAIHKVVSC